MWSATGALHIGLAAVGLVVLTTSPCPSSTTHNDVDGHETPLPDSRLASIFVDFLHVGLGAVGLVVIRALPSSSVTTHNDFDAHEAPTAVSPIREVLQAGCAAPGSVDMNAFPDPSTATHSNVSVQDTPSRAALWSTPAGMLHVGLAAAGLRVTVTAPVSTATHSLNEGQEIP